MPRFIEVNIANREPFPQELEEELFDIFEDTYAFETGNGEAEVGYGGDDVDYVVEHLINKVGKYADGSIIYTIDSVLNNGQDNGKHMFFLSDGHVAKKTIEGREVL